MAEFGYVEPLVWNRTTGVLVGGHQRFKILKAQGAKTVQVSVVELDEEREVALNIALNKIEGEWDIEKLKMLLEPMQIEIRELTGFDMADFVPAGASRGSPESYTQKVVIPIYEPTGAAPALGDLVDRTKADALAKEIDEADLPDELAQFLRDAAERHVVFRFDRIANYYANADATVQELMERSALVIIDFEKAIEYGFAQLNADIDAAFAEDHPDA